MNGVEMRIGFFLPRYVFKPSWSMVCFLLSLVSDSIPGIQDQTSLFKIIMIHCVCSDFQSAWSGRCPPHFPTIGSLFQLLVHGQALSLCWPC